MPEPTSLRPDNVDAVTRIINTAIADHEAGTLNTARFDEPLAAGKDVAGDE